MTFNEAKERIKEIANGNYFSLNYCYMSYSEVEEECRIYIGGENNISYTGKNWESVVKVVEAMVKAKNSKNEEKQEPS